MLGMPAMATIMQTRPETRPMGWKCRVRRTRAIHYCGIASYKKAIPIHTASEPVTVDVGMCWQMAHRMSYDGPYGTKHPLAIPGRTEL